ncbi:MAG: hypothetical protein ACLR2G_02800 [Phascolarctobacterium faecium]
MVLTIWAGGAVFGTTTKNDAGYLGLDGLQVSDRLLRHLLSVSEASTAPILNRYCKPCQRRSYCQRDFGSR